MSVARGEARNAIVGVMGENPLSPMTSSEIASLVEEKSGTVLTASTVRSCLNLNTPGLFTRVERGKFILSDALARVEKEDLGKSRIYHADCLKWMRVAPRESISAVVTDPPYGLVEYSEPEKGKLRRGHGGVWRIPPNLDGYKRSPMPRFTTLTDEQRRGLYLFFEQFTEALIPLLVPGAHVMMASNPLLSHIVGSALEAGGLERRGVIIRLVQTLRGGDRPKNHEVEYPDVTVMPRSQWEPWLLYRKPFEGTVADNLAQWGTGALRRVDDAHPFGDVIRSSPTTSAERKLAPHPSLKPQALMRQLVRASLPLGDGIVLDPFAGSGSTLAAANSVGYRSVGIESDMDYFNMAIESIPRLTAL